MENDNKTPGENQDTSEKLLLGKYKTMEEVAAAMQEQQRKMTELSSQLDAERSVNRLFEETNSTTKKNGGYEPTELPPTVDEDTAKWFETQAQRIRQLAVHDAVSQVGEILSARELVNNFYREHPDLDNFRDIVRTEYDRMKSERNGKLQNTPEVMNEVSRRARQRVQEIQSKGKNPPPHLESGNSLNRSAPKERDKEHAEPDDEENLRTFMEDRRKASEKRLNLTR